MELHVGNGWMGRGWLFDGLEGFLRQGGIAREEHTVPPTDIVEDREGYHFYFEMPGLKAETLNVRVEEDRLVVEAERKRPQWPKDAQLHKAERAYGTVRRAFRLPEDASHDGITAAYRDGVLEVTVAKRPEAKPIKVQVNVQN